MPITSDNNGKNYTLGRGRIMFDRFAAGAVIDGSSVGEGYKYIGNTPEVTVSSQATNLDHYDADQGVKTKDDAVMLEMNRTGKFKTDNIDAYNLALLFLGSANTLTQAAAMAVVETRAVKLGHSYQLGESQANPTGVRKVSNVTVKKGAPGFATAVVAAGNYEVDAERGIVYILSDAAAITDGLTLQFTYDVALSDREQVISSSQSLYGQVKFLASNPKGVNRDVYMPYVKLTPDGDFALKGDNWQELSFTCEILKRGNLEALYVDGQPA